jgi:hypothetical protein
MIVMIISSTAISHPTAIQRLPVKSKGDSAEGATGTCRNRGGSDARWQTVASDKPFTEHRQSTADLDVSVAPPSFAPRLPMNERAYAPM